MGNEPQERDADEITIRNPHVFGTRKPAADNLTPWGIFGVVVAAVVVGNFVWWWGTALYAQHELALAQEKAEVQRQEAEKQLSERKAEYYRQEGVETAARREALMEHDRESAAAEERKQSLIFMAPSEDIGNRTSSSLGENHDLNRGDVIKK